jgi:hypothetical protein
VGQNERKQAGGSSSDPEKTQQWAGHLRHQQHLAEQERERRLRHRLDPVIKRKGKK